MLEMMLGFLSFAAVTAGVRVYLSFFVARGKTHEAFERWCGNRPLVFAMFVPRAPTDLVVRRARATLQTQPLLVNLAAGFPWTHYGLGLEASAIGECVVGVSIVSARVLRGDEAPPSIVSIVRAVAQAAREEATEIWLHTELFASREDAVTERTAGWCGTVDEHGELRLSPRDELPFWLRALPPRGPRDGRQRTDDARVADLVNAPDGVTA